MRFDELNESNYLLFAIKFYDNPQAVTKDDFEDDLKRIRYIKKFRAGDGSKFLAKWQKAKDSPAPLRGA